MVVVVVVAVVDSSSRSTGSRKLRVGSYMDLYGRVSVSSSTPSPCTSFLFQPSGLPVSDCFYTLITVISYLISFSFSVSHLHLLLLQSLLACLLTPPLLLSLLYFVLLWSLLICLSPPPSLFFSYLLLSHFDYSLLQPGILCWPFTSNCCRL